MLDLNQQSPDKGSVRLLSLRVFSPVPAAIESTAMLSRGGAVWAMTLRLEKPADYWLCTHLQTIRPGPRVPETG
jgi:hypothetical protein